MPYLVTNGRHCPAFLEFGLWLFISNSLVPWCFFHKIIFFLSFLECINPQWTHTYMPQKMILNTELFGDSPIQKRKSVCLSPLKRIFFPVHVISSRYFCFTHLCCSKTFFNIQNISDEISLILTISILVKLKALIDAASAEEVLFVYAISPGLDVTFSSAADISALKRKMKQVN